MNKNPFLYVKNLAIKLKRHSSIDWVEESFLFQDQNGEILGVSINKKRLIVLFLIISLGILGLASRAFFLQIFQGNHFRELSDNNRIRQEVIKTNRGIIKDRNYTQLVFNKPYFNIFLIPVNLPKDPDKFNNLIDALTVILKMPSEDILEILNNISTRDNRYHKPQLIKAGVFLEDTWNLFILAKEFPALYIEVDSYREYLTNKTENTNSLSHILGYEGKINENELDIFSKLGYLLTDKIGKTGIEEYYEEFLKGVHGKRFWEVDALLRPQKILSETEKIIGDDLILSIDLNYQEKLEEIIKRYLKKQGLNKGGGIVMDPNNGEILAMVSLPAYDNNNFATGISNAKYNALINDKNVPLINRMISGEYPAGSTFKLIVGAAALEEGIIDDTDYFISTGGIKIDKWFFPDWRSGGHGKTNIYKAIYDSVNTFFYMIGGGDPDFTGLGVNRIVRYADKFNLGRKLGIDLPGEEDGFLPNPEWKEEYKNENWYIGDTYHLAIGQGDMLVTPLQVAEFTAFFANKGTLYVPHLLKERHNEQLNVHEKFTPIVIRNNIISEKNINIIRKALRQTVTKGSGRSLSNLPMTVAGKTGTAQWKLDEKPHAWWTCFAPYENPEIVVTIFIEEGEEGTKISVPIAKDFLTWWWSQR